MINLLEILPKNIKVGKKNLNCKPYPETSGVPEKNKIKFWYGMRTPSNGEFIHFKILPKFIKDKKNLYETIGIYFAEGGMSPKSNVISLSNDEPLIINNILKTFKRYFKIPFSNWSWSICFNEKLKRQETKKMTEERERASLNFWLKETEIKPESVSPKPFLYSNKNSAGKLKTKKKWGSLSVRYGNRILKTLWIEIMKKLTQKVIQEKNKFKAASILRGWIAGDGYCRCNVYDKPYRELGITCADKEKIKIIQKLFEILEIKPLLSEKEVKIVKAEFLAKAYKWRLTSLHLLKQRNLLKALLNYRKIPEPIKKLNLKEIEKKLKKVEREIKKREILFESLSKGNKKLLKLNENINWRFLINGLVIKNGGNYEKVMKEIGCPKTVLINWCRKGIKPSKKYKRKILEKIPKKERNKLIRFGEFFLKGNWQALFEGLQIFFKIARERLAQKLKIHINTIEGIVNQRNKIGKKVAGKVLNLIDMKGKSPNQIVQIYNKCQNINWPIRIKRILIENEWSQRELAEKLGCSRSLVREWLGGLEPTNEYKGKLLEMTFYNGKVGYNFRDFIKNYLKNHKISDLVEKLNVSWNTIKNWKDGDRIQLRHIKKIAALAERQMTLGG